MLGWGDFYFFGQAFLLFSANLVGIIVAATFAFRILGFSPAIRSKRNLAAVLCLLALISVPLWISYNRIVEDQVIENSWRKERFLVNGKYIIVEKATLRRVGKIIKIGIIAAFSGSDFAKGEEGQRGGRTAIAMRPLLNNGDKVELVVKDDQNDPAKARRPATPPWASRGSRSCSRP